METLKRKHAQGIITAMITVLCIIGVQHTAPLPASAANGNSEVSTNSDADTSVANLDIKTVNSNTSEITTTDGVFRMNPDGSVSVVTDTGMNLYTLEKNGQSQFGASKSYEYEIENNTVFMTWTDTLNDIGPPAMTTFVSMQDISCWLAIAGMALATGAVIVATAGTAAAFGFAGASYVISAGGVVFGCYE